jgi:hypothetical protein
MITFFTGEATNIPNCIIKEGGEYEDLELVPISKVDAQDELYTMIQAYFLKWGYWK